jgi:hypothetical protein
MGANIDAWRIYFVKDVRQAIPRAKDKLIAIVCIPKRGMGFMISTEIDVWIQIDEERLACQANILADEHSGCLTHDSWVNCYNLLAFWDEELVNPRDFISPNAKSSIQDAARKSPTIEQRYKDQIINS